MAGLIKCLIRINSEIISCSENGILCGSDQARKHFPPQLFQGLIFHIPPYPALPVPLGLKELYYLFRLLQRLCGEQGIRITVHLIRNAVFLTASCICQELYVCLPILLHCAQYGKPAACRLYLLPVNCALMFRNVDSFIHSPFSFSI